MATKIDYKNTDPLLLTPGPLTTSAEVKQAMLHDWGSRDPLFIDATKNVREVLVKVSGGGDAFTAGAARRGGGPASAAGKIERTC